MQSEFASFTNECYQREKHEQCDIYGQCYEYAQFDRNMNNMINIINATNIPRAKIKFP